LKVIASVAPESVQWECVSCHAPEGPASAWTDTRISFQLVGWDEKNRFYPFCNCEWAMPLRKWKQVCEAK
jgi:hypothetical protein